MDDKSSQVTINFTSEPDAGERDAVEVGIATLRKRAHDFHSVRRATDLALALAAPPPPERKRVEVAADDPAVIAADEAVALEQQAFLDAMTLNAPRPTAGETVFFGGGAAAGVASEVFAIPYHYDWRWHVGSIVFENTPDRPTGRIRVSVVGKRRCDAHAGFGIGVRANRDHWMTARSLRRSAESCRVRSGATGAVALAEGGMEMTVMEGANLLDVEQDKRFRFRLNPGFWSDPEEANHDSGGFGTGASIEVRWFALAGHTYQVNVGAWVLAEWTSGPHAAGDISRSSGGVVGDVLAITLFHG